MAIHLLKSQAAAALATAFVLAASAHDPPNRVIYLHYDYMVGTERSFAPDPRSIDLVVEAFRRQGITLHIDPVHHAIALREVVTVLEGFTDPKCVGTDAVAIGELRKAYFEPHGNHPWHYAVFAHLANCPDTLHCGWCPTDRESGATPDSLATGSAELPGYNFVIAGANLDIPRRVSLEASTLMHELGHNLGLKHGGDESTNNKPNYVSVMNYTYQFLGIPVAGAAGSFVPRACGSDRDCESGSHCLELAFCARVDYSARRLATLPEYALDEGRGISGSPGDTDIVMYFVPGSPPVEPFGASDGPIDWNIDGVLGPGTVVVDLNFDKAFTDLTGFDDWAHLKAVLNTPDYRNGVARKDGKVVHCSP